MAATILHVLGSSQRDWEGITTLVINLASRIPQNRYVCRALVLDGGGDAVERLRQLDIAVDTVRWRGGAADPVGAVAFFMKLRRLRVSLVHSHVGGRALVSLARHATGARIVCHHYSQLTPTCTGMKELPIPTFNGDRILVVSQATARMVSGQSTVVYPGVAIPETSDRQTTGEMIVGTSGRLVPLKGYDDAIRAIAIVRRSCPSVRLEICGVGSEEETLKALATELGIDDIVSFVGWAPDLAAFRNRWTIFLHPALYDALPVAVVEAMAQGIPVVSTTAGGIPEAVVHGETGFLSSPGDYGSLSAHLLRLLSDEDLRRRMGAAGRARAEEVFSIARMVNDVLHVYDDLLAAPGGTAACAR
jgi:glycosyltransferase involved in cell wall biosynthesis